MSFPKATQSFNPSDEYIAAHERYRRACSEYTKIRLYTCHPASTDADLARHERARRVFKAECKDYALARDKFISAIRTEKQGAVQISNAEIVESFNDLNLKRVLEEDKKEYVLKATDQVYLEEITKTSAMSPEQRDKFIASGLTLDKFLEQEIPADTTEIKAGEAVISFNSSNDPTAGDFKF
jgi:hypothetical protein